MPIKNKSPKELWLIRHAHALTTDDAATDPLRPLSPKGRKQARLLGEWLNAQNLKKAQLLLSPALRSQETGAEIQRNLKSTWPSETEPLIYTASTALDLLERLRQIPDRYQHVLIVGHNPLLKELLALLVQQPFWGPFHKGAVARLELTTPTWKDLSGAKVKDYWLSEAPEKRWQFYAHLGLGGICQHLEPAGLELVQQAPERLREWGDGLARNLWDLHNTQINRDQEGENRS